MDFALTDEQQAVVDLADQILTDRATPEQIKHIELSGSRIDRDLWSELAKADLLGLTIPEQFGGAGFGFLESCLILQEIGRRVAPVPYWATLVLGALPIARFGTDAQKETHLSGIAAGETLLSAALDEPGASPREPYTSATADGDGWVLSGTKILVPIAAEAQAVLVPARTDDGSIAVFLVAPDAAGVTVEVQDTVAFWPAHQVTLDGVRVGADDVLGGSIDDGRTQLDWIVDRATVGLTAISSGVAAQAVRLTADYATERKQFDRPIGSFQAVGQRMANAYIDARAIRLTMLNAASLLDADLPADKEVATAKFWAGEGGNRVVLAALHVHGGISIDIDYPIHRYFQWGKQIENDLGSATPQLERLAEIIKAEPVSA